MYYYKVFGLVVSSLSSLNWPLNLIRQSDEIACEIAQVPDSISKFGLDLIYTSPVIVSGTSKPKLQIFSSAGGMFLSYPEYGNFEIQSSRVTYYLPNVLDPQMLEALLFRAVLVLWLELIGMPVLHASGVAISDDLAVGFLANSAAGKSTLAAAFLSNSAKLLTDDIFPVEMRVQGYWARPSYAWLRLLPEAAWALGYQTVKKVEIHPSKFAVRLDGNCGRFCPDPVPLATLYLPERRDDLDAIFIQTLSPKQAYLGLIRHAFTAKWLVRSPLNARRLEFFANLVKEVPIKQLVYPSGYEYLPAVVEAVHRDLGL